MAHSFQSSKSGSMPGLVLLSVLAIVSICAGFHGSAAASIPTPPTHQFSVDRPAFDHKEDAKGVVNKLVAEDYEGIRRDFNDTMKSGLSAEKMREVWRAVIDHLGQYKSQSEPQSNSAQNWEAVVIRCQMERGQVDVEVDYDPEGKIGGLWVRPVQ